jgi:tRNA (guanine-N7-)-methyltransferase
MPRPIVVPNPINFRGSEIGATLVNRIEKKARTRVEEEKLELLSYEKLFGNKNPVELEIGCGRGKFLIARSQVNPHINFIGIDRAGKWMKRGINRVDRQKMSNIQFIRVEAKRFLSEAIPPESVSLFHMYFPDPWPKRRHHDRRTVNADFLRLLHSRLLPGGLIELATDDADYFTAMKKSIAATAELWENVRETRNERIFAAEMKTNYELKFEAEGRPLYYAELRAA